MNPDMVKRCIMIFPIFNNMNVIDEIRDKYDPFVNNVRPHITLVFPFDSEIKGRELEQYLRRNLSDIKAFHIKLKDIIKIDDTTGMYLFLSVKEGNEVIKKINKLLYSEMLKEYKPNFLNEIEFMPHMTLGKFDSRAKLNLAFEDIKNMNEEFNALVEKIAVEIIDENMDSIIEMEIELNKL